MNVGDSVLLIIQGKSLNIIIDTSPDMRQQLINNKITNIDKVLFSHMHADQTHGINDLRVFYLKNRKPVDIYADLPTKKYLNKNTFPYSNKINFNSIRKGEIIGKHEVKFSSGKEIITLNHEAFDRALYSEGALSAAKWLMKKKSGLYSMRDLMNFK